jgi:hypothetical protein
MAKRRWDIVRQKAAQAILDEGKAIDFSVRTPADALALLAAKQYTALMDSDKPVIEQFERLVRFVTGNDVNPQRENAAAPGTVTFGDPDTLVRLFELVGNDKQQAVDRSRAVDAE